MSCSKSCATATWRGNGLCRVPCSSRATSRRSRRGLPAPVAGSLLGDGLPAAGELSRPALLRHIAERLAAHKEQLQVSVQRENYSAAAHHRDAVRTLELHQRRLELEEAVAERRGVQHQLGDVIMHRRYEYRGVIVGYDPRCLAPEEWIQSMNIDLLPHGRYQPFYHVLVDERDKPGALITYLAQEVVTATRSAREVQHPLLEHYFTVFLPSERAYVPGAKIRAEYPQDF